MGSSQRATWCSFIKKYHIKGIISDEQLLEIKKVAFSKDLEATFRSTHFKERER